MKLSGLARINSRPQGGVVAVEIVCASAFSAIYDRAADCFTKIETAEPLAAFVFREDTARYEETSSSVGEPPLVKHTFTMEFPAGADTRRAVGELSAASGEGFVALITTGNGERLLAGYSARFGTEYPLRLAGIACASGSRPADFPSVTVILESEDTEYSKPLRD